MGRVFPMLIWSKFHMGQNRDDDHWEDAPQFIKRGNRKILVLCYRVLPTCIRTFA